MRERPILFSGPMVRAILSGTKTQTRRVISSTHAQEADAWQDCDSGRWESGIAGDHGRYGHGEWVRCPYGVPGDRLWVRESGWYHVEHYEQDEDSECCSAEFFRWKATPREGCRRWLPPLDHTRIDRITFLHDSTPLEHAPKGDPIHSIHMPRWASRITLEVTGVRVERLQEIIEQDILAEGVTIDLVSRMTGVSWSDMPTLHDAWREGWDAINGKAGRRWADNPWVWRVCFRRIA